MDELRHPWLGAFAALALVHLALVGADVTPWDSVTKCLLAPLLVGWVLQQGGPRILAVALALCFGGDLFLEIEGAFVIGMASFALAHIAFIAYFVSRGAARGLRERPWILVALLVPAAVLVPLVWGGIDDVVVRWAIPVYTVVLVGTAATALVTEARAGLGAVLFLISDAIIALGVAGRIDDTTAVVKLAIMVLYLSAIYALATGVVRREQSSPLDHSTVIT